MPDNPSAYSIILAEDHALVREGIRSLINATPGLSVVGEAEDGISLLRLLEKIQPRMVILDIAMPGMRGIEAAREIRVRHPAIHILFLSMHRRREFLAMAFAAGAKGYLLKEDSSQELITAIDEIRSGRTYLSRKLAMEFPTEIIGIFRGEAEIEGDPLTPREREVLKLIAEGHTDREISEKLFISLRTAQRHHGNIREKLNLRRTADLIRYAIDRGYIEPHL
jgi:DNA-binding NarL/FixJ family response regulator